MIHKIWHLGRDKTPGEQHGDFYLERVVSSALERCEDYGVAWIYRGLYCGVAARYRDDRDAFFMCRLDLNEVSLAEKQWLLWHARPGRIGIRSASDLARTFPSKLVRDALRGIASGVIGVDGVPMCLHQIEDRNSRRVAIDAYRSNQL